MMAKFLVALIFFTLFLPVVVSAEVPPELNTLCWRQKDCDDARKKFGSESGDGGWFQETPCIGEWGKCLPAGKTKTEIAFGGKKEFANIGDFFATNYNIALTIASILAVIMIVIAGFQWTTSGGNSEMITSAKKKIGGSLTGLLIAYLSYTILNTINPAMVNLRLPQTFLIRPVVLVSNALCINLEKEMQVALVQKETDSPPDNSYIPAFKELTDMDGFWTNASDYEILNPLRESDTKCGQMYLIKDGAGATCKGSKCGIGEVCVGDKTKTCQKFSTSGEVNGIKGKISHKDEKYVDYIWLYAICAGSDKEGHEAAGKIVEVKTEDTDSDSDQYKNFTNIDLGTVCDGGYENIDGFFFKVELNDSDGIPTKDDWWVGGLSMCKNISSAPSCGIFGKNSIEDADISLAASSLGMNNQLIRRSYIKNGLLCDFDFEQNVTPNIGNGLIIGGIAGLSSDAKKGMEFFSKVSGSDLLVKEGYYAGINYNCPYFTNESVKFKEKLLKLKCKLHPEKSECTK